jgi:hypothetical protein
MLAEDSSKKAKAFLVTGYHKELKVSQKLMQGHQAYNQLRQKLQTDKTLPDDILPPQIDGLAGHISLIEQMLKLPLYAEAETAYQFLITHKITNPNWYQFYRGPRNLEQLAAQLNRQGVYEVLYRAWSGAVHGSDVLKGKLVQDEDGLFGISQIRNPEDAQMITQYVHSLALILFRFYVEKRVPSRQSELDIWYQSIREVFLSFARAQND